MILCSACSKGPFDNLNDHWSIDEGTYRNLDLNNLFSQDYKLVYRSDMYFYKSKMFLDQGDSQDVVVKYSVLEQINEYTYKVRILCEKDSVDEIGIVIWDNLTNGIDRNGCEEMMFKSVSLNLYLWRHCNGYKSFLDVIDEGRDINIEMFQQDSMSIH